MEYCDSLIQLYFLLVYLQSLHYVKKENLIIIIDNCYSSQLIKLRFSLLLFPPSLSLLPSLLPYCGASVLLAKVLDLRSRDLGFDSSRLVMCKSLGSFESTPPLSTQQ